MPGDRLLDQQSPLRQANPGLARVAAGSAAALDRET